MTRAKVIAARCRCALPALVVLAAAGCQSASKTDLQAARQRAFERRLTGTTQALHEGDLVEARAQLEQAAANVSTKSQRRKVESLEMLIAGAEALMSGDPASARAEWSRIEDPNLKQEVREKAQLVGMAVPAKPIESEVRQ
ncbi:MAG: hypothetical protein ACYTJ0_13830 [Planctomycetota bacterium]|jgi:hypothetical protein